MARCLFLLLITNILLDMKTSIRVVIKIQSSVDCNKELCYLVVISWLNKQLDQVQIGRTRIGTTSSLPVHTVSITQTSNTRSAANIHTTVGGITMTLWCAVWCVQENCVFVLLYPVLYDAIVC